MRFSWIKGLWFIRDMHDIQTSFCAVAAKHFLGTLICLVSPHSKFAEHYRFSILRKGLRLKMGPVPVSKLFSCFFVGEQF